MSEQSDTSTFAPHARYAANATDGIRFKDEETGQEQLSLPATITRFIEAGASLGDLAGGRVVTRVKIGPYQPPDPQWKVELTYSRLEKRPKDSETIDFVRTVQSVRSEVFDDRLTAVRYAERHSHEFDNTLVKDAREYRANRN